MKLSIKRLQKYLCSKENEIKTLTTAFNYGSKPLFEMFLCCMINIFFKSIAICRCLTFIELTRICHTFSLAPSKEQNLQFKIKQNIAYGVKRVTTYNSLSLFICDVYSSNLLHFRKYIKSNL